jgi:hypothetical protein
MPRGTLGPVTLSDHFHRLTPESRKEFLSAIGAERLADRNGEAAPLAPPPVVDPVRQQLDVCKAVVAQLEDTVSVIADIRDRVAPNGSHTLQTAIDAINAATLAMARFALSRVPRPTTKLEARPIDAQTGG